MRLKWYFQQALTRTTVAHAQYTEGEFDVGVWSFAHSIKTMGQLEELKLFISERLHAVTTEILGAIDKAITDYEDQASPFKKENGDHLPMLDTVVKSSIPKTEGRCIIGCIH